MEPTTRERIMEAAIELFGAKGYANVSVRELAAAVGIKPASIYNHFSGKEEILNFILENVAFSTHKGLRAKAFLELEDRIQGKGIHELIDIIFGSFDSEEVERSRKVARILILEQFSSPTVEEFWTGYQYSDAIRVFTQLLELLKKKKKLKPDTNCRLIAEAMIRISASYLVQFAHYQDCLDEGEGLSMMSVLHGMADAICAKNNSEDS